MSGVVGIHLEHPLEGGDDLRRVLGGLVVDRIELPRGTDHHGLGVERADVGVVRESVPDLGHGVGVGLVEMRPVRRPRLFVAE
jgi:hypothetical protein